jgi:salicylate hydroxylase
MNLESFIEVDIYEAASELTQMGAGISFCPRAWRVLEKLGLETSLVEHLSPGQHLPGGEPCELPVEVVLTV